MQVHIVYNIIRNALERKEYCTAAYVDITQAFDKVLHIGLLYKLKLKLPYKFFELNFRIKLNEYISELHPINAGIFQRSGLGPVLYTIYSTDLPTSLNWLLGKYSNMSPENKL